MRDITRMKKVLSILLCLCIVLSYVPATVFAAGTEEVARIWVGGQQMTVGGSINGNIGGTATLTKDGDDYILTLNNYRYAGNGHCYSRMDFSIYYGIYAEEPLTIKVQGANSINVIGGNQDNDSGYGIDAEYGLTIDSGNAGDYLYVIGNGASNNAGIKVGSTGNLTICGDGEVKASGVPDQREKADNISSGIATLCSINISGNCTVTAIGGNAKVSSGINIDAMMEEQKALNISGNATVTAIAGETGNEYLGYDSCGICAPNVNITGGTVTATGDTVTGNSKSIGICQQNRSFHGNTDCTLNIQNSTVTATGGNFGIQLYSDMGECKLNISNSKLTAKGNEQAVDADISTGAGQWYQWRDSVGGSFISEPLNYNNNAYLQICPLPLVNNLWAGTSGISGYNSTNGYNYIYMGYWMAPDSNTTSGAIKWRVLDDQTNTGDSGLFLLSDVLLGTGTSGGVYFDNSGNNSSAWQGSTAQAWCKDFAGEEGAATNVTDAFTAGELGAVLATTKSDQYFIHPVYPFLDSNNILNGDKVFFMSAEEAVIYSEGFTDWERLAANYGTSMGSWWLRSPYDTSNVGVIDSNALSYLVYCHVNRDYPARPAFNLDQNAVLFTSAAKGGKQGTTGSITEISTSNTTEWKLTLKDSSRSGFTAETTRKNGDTLTVSYSGATTGANEYISVMVADSTGAYTHYGRIKNITDAANASGTVEINLSGIDMTGKTLYVFNEQYNGGANDDTKLTDYASNFEAVILDPPVLWVGGTAVTRQNTSGAGWSYDYATNTLTLNGASITSGSYADASIYAKEALNIVLNGSNTVSSGANFGIYADSSVNISGDGSLDVIGHWDGIQAHGNVTVNSGSITSTGESSYGIKAEGNTLTFNGGYVSANGGASGNGIVANTVVLGSSSHLKVTHSSAAVAGTLSAISGLCRTSANGTFTETIATSGAYFEYMGSDHVTYTKKDAQNHTVACAHGISFDATHEYENGVCVCTAEDRAETTSIAGATVTVNGTFTYDSNAKTPDPVVVLNGETLIKDQDYTVSYANNVNAGQATVTVTGMGNYTGSANGNMTVNAKPITVTIQNATSIYGEALAELKATDNGIVNGDTDVYSLATVATSASNVGLYAITGVVLDGNYDVTFVNGEYEITKREITITVEEKNTIVNTALPTYTYKVEGLFGEDKLVTEPTLTSNADITEIGEYDITATGADAGNNYSIKYVPAKLTVLTDNAVDAAAGYAEELKDYDPATVTSEDKDELQDMLDEINTILGDETITTNGKNTMEEVKKQVEDLIKAIDDAAKVTDTENTDKVEDVTADNVTPDDKSDLEKAKADLEKALNDNGGNYTAEEKKAIKDELKRIDDALKVIENVENIEEAISDLPATVEPDDEENVAKIEAAKKAYDALSTYEKSLVGKQTKENLDKLTAAAVAYDIIKGDGSEWKEDSNETLSFTANGAVSRFLGIEINGKTVDPKHYEVKAGSTIVTLKQDYLDTLEAGKYTITFLYTNGETEGTFIVEAVEEETVPPTTEETKPSTGPATGDDANVMLWFCLMIVSCAVILVLLNYKRFFSYGGKYRK